MTVHWTRWLVGIDTGVYTQIILNTFHGYRSAFENGSHLAVHFSPILGVLYPLLAFAHTGLALEYAQVLLVAAVPLAMYVLVRPHVDASLALRIGLLTLLYPPLAAIGIGEFHPLVFLPLLVIGLVWAADRARWGWFACLAVLSLLVREDVLVEFAIIGLVAGPLAMRSTRTWKTLLQDPLQRRRLGIACLGVGVAAASLAGAYFGIIQPSYGRSGWYPLVYYQYGFARGAAGILTPPPVSPPPNPAATPFMQVIERCSYLLEAVLPLALLPFRTRWWLLAVPGLAIVLSATSASIWTMGSHYALLWAPWLLLATAVALVEMRSQLGERAARGWSAAAIAGCLFFLIAFNPMHLGYYLRPAYHDLPSAQRALACVPPGASLATHDEWFTHIAGVNPRATGGVIDNVQYLVYAEDYPDATFQREIKPKLDAAAAAGRFRVTCTFGNVRTYERTGM